jgi:hypothetical protein
MKIFPSTLLFIAFTPFLVWGAYSRLRLEAKDARGFAFVGERRVLVNNCFYELRRSDSGVTISLNSDAGIQFHFSELLSLPLRSGVIPTHQAGLNASYEGGILAIRRTGREGLEETSIRIKLEIDPTLTRPQRALLQQRSSGGFPPRTGRETQRLECEF